MSKRVTTGIDETYAGARRLLSIALCIRPSQVATVNEGFAPSEDELAWARRVLDAFKAANGAAVAVDGKMADRPVVQRAQSILDAIGV